MMVFYSLVTANATPENIVDPGLAPRPGEAVPAGGPDKFLSTDLDKRLKDKGIKTVIVTGTSAQGAVMGSGNALMRSAATRSSFRSTAWLRRTTTTSNMRSGISTKAVPPW